MDARLRLNDLLAATGTVVALLLGGCATAAPEPAPPSVTAREPEKVARPEFERVRPARG